MPERKRTLFERSAEVQWIADRLREVKENDVITYKEMSEICGRDVARGGRGIMDSARRILVTEDQIEFAPVRKVGLRRLDDEGVINARPSGLKFIRNKAKRELQKTACVSNMESLAPASRAKLIAYQSCFGIVRALAKERTVKRIEGKCGELQRRLNPSEILGSLKDQANGDGEDPE